MKRCESGMLRLENDMYRFRNFLDVLRKVMNSVFPSYGFEIKKLSLRFVGSLYSKYDAEFFFPQTDKTIKIEINTEGWSDDWQPTNHDITKGAIDSLYITKEEMKINGLAESNFDSALSDFIIKLKWELFGLPE